MKGSNLNCVTHPLQLLKRLLFRRDKFLHTIPGRASWEDVLEHIQGRVVSRCLLYRIDSSTNSATIDENLCVPQAALRTGAKDWVLSLNRTFFYLVVVAFLLLQCVHQGHRFVGFSQMRQLNAFQDVFVIDWSVLLGHEGFYLERCVLAHELLLRSHAATGHSYDLLEGEVVEVRLR